MKDEKQYHRCVFLIELLKNKRVKEIIATSFIATLAKEQDYRGNIGGFSIRTFYRDIDFLKNRYHAPIEYDKQRHSYVLTDKTWSFELPLPFDRKEFSLHTMLGLKTLAEITPGSFKNNIVSHSTQTARSQIPKTLLDQTLLEHFIVASGLKVEISTEIFKTLFYAWWNCQTVKIRYNNPKGSKTTREIEPQVIAYRHGIWYVKGYKITRTGEEKSPNREIRVLPIYRILSVERLPDLFERDHEMLLDIEKNGLFTYPKLNDIKVRCDASIAFYLKEHQKLKKFKVKPLDGGDLEITFDNAFEHELLRWILGEAGRVEVLAPSTLRKKVSAAALSTYEKNK